MRLPELFSNAIVDLIGDYESGRFAPKTEADIQSHLYARILGRLADDLRPIPVHVNWRLASSPPGRKRAMHDLVLGNDEVIVEIKFEPKYAGVSSPVCFADEIVKDVDRLKLAIEHGIPSCHFLLIDEAGCWHRNLHKYVSSPLPWREIRRDAKGVANLLHLQFHRS